MGSVELNLPALPQGERVELSPKVKEFLLRSALDYRMQHANAFSDFPDSGLQAAGRIVETVYMDAVGLEPKPPTSTQEMIRILKEGFKQREKFITSSSRVIHVLEINDKKETENLGIPFEELAQAKQEFVQWELRPDFPAFIRLLQKKEDRTVILPSLAEQLLVPILERTGIADPKQVRSFIPDSEQQSMIVRGVTLYGLGQLLGIKDINPVFISDENITDLVEALEDGEEILPMITAVADSLTERFTGSFEPAVLKSAFTDYAHQTVTLLRAWSKVQKARSLSPDSLDYWDEKNRILDKLPINAFTLDIQQIIKDHIWENSTEAGGVEIPSLSSIEAVLQIMRRSGVPPYDESVVILRKAHNKLIEYRTTENLAGAVVRRQEQRIGELTEYLHANRFLRGVKTESIVGLSGQLRQVNNNLVRFKRARKHHQTTEELLQQIGYVEKSGIEADTIKTRLIILGKRIERQKNNQEAVIGRVYATLDRPGWRRFITANLKNYYNDPVRIQEELDLTGKYIDELEQNPNRALPADFYQDRAKLQDFIVSEMSAIVWNLSKNKDYHLTIVDELNEIIQHARRRDLEWMGFRRPFLSSLISGERNLQKLPGLQANQRETDRILKLVTTSLDTGQPEAELIPLLNALGRRDITRYVKEMAMSILPEGIAATVTADQIKEALRVIGLHVKAKGFRLTFPASEQIEEELDSRLELQTGAPNEPLTNQHVYFLQALRDCISNPLFPKDVVEGMTTAPVIDALRRRVQFAQAFLFEPEYRERQKELTNRLKLARKQREYFGKEDQLKKAKEKVEQTERNQKRALKEIIDTLLPLGLVRNYNIESTASSPEQPEATVLLFENSATTSIEEKPVFPEVGPLPSKDIQLSMRKFTIQIAEEIARQVGDLDISRDAVPLSRTHRDLLTALSQQKISEGEVGRKIQEAAQWLLRHGIPPDLEQEFIERLMLQNSEAARLFGSGKAFEQIQRAAGFIGPRNA